MCLNGPPFIYGVLLSSLAAKDQELGFVALLQFVSCATGTIGHLQVRHSEKPTPFLFP